MPIGDVDVREHRCEPAPQRGLRSCDEGERGQQHGRTRPAARWSFEHGVDRGDEPERTAGDRYAISANAIGEPVAKQPPAGPAVAEPPVLARELKVALDLRRAGKARALKG